jgi:hypothetical protein
MQRFTLREGREDANGSGYGVGYGTVKGQGGMAGARGSVSGSYLQRVKCPVLVTGAAESLYLDVTDHTAMVFNALAGEKELWVGTSPGEGGLQAKMGAIGLVNQRVFAFFDRQFGVVRRPSSM